MTLLHPRLTAKGVVLARRGERLRAIAERDGEGWVVGYGHRASAREGASVSADDALALLVYDLSRSAASVEPLLRRPTPQPVFDALNSYARRVGPEAFARSELLRRWNGEGELAFDPPPAEAASPPPASAPSAVLAAAEAVRDRLSQVLDVAAEPPARPRRKPWPEPYEPAPPPSAEPAPVKATPGEAPAEPPPLLDAPTATPSAPDESVAHVDLAAPMSAPEALAPEALAPAPHPAATARAASVAPRERGGRLWERLRANPYLYMAVGACGAGLFLCALAAVATEKPTVRGVLLGLVGLLCLAPAVAFFLQRRTL